MDSRRGGSVEANYPGNLSRYLNADMGVREKLKTRHIFAIKKKMVVALASIVIKEDKSFQS